MTEALYIWIPNWHGPGGFQHYRDRDPIWIKNYTRLLSHDAYMGLSMTQRGLLHGVWLEYASSARRLRGDTLTLTRRLGQRVSNRDIRALNHAGFIELIASSVLAERLQLASDPLALARVKAEREVEKKEPVPEPVPEANYAERASDDIDFGPPPSSSGNGAGAGAAERTQPEEIADMRLDPHAILRAAGGTT